jgi:small-conductance mechanosensitive channel/CRP-like cAMP-binding protein
MERIVGWLSEEGGSVAALVAVVVALLAMIVSPPRIRTRLRAAFLLGLVASLLSLIDRLRSITPDDHSLLRLAVYLCSALAAARVAFVVAVDLVLERAGRKPMNRLVHDVLQAAAYAVAGIVAMRAAKISPTSLIATGTVVTAIVGLALQETLGNLAAGVAIQMEKPIELGEWIQLDANARPGRVVSTSWRSVTIQTDDRAQFVIPNGVFSKTPFFNLSRPGGSMRMSVTFTVPYDVPPARVHGAVIAACLDCPEVLTSPPPSVLTSRFVDHGIEYWLRFFIGDFARRDVVRSEVSTRIWYRLHREQIPIAVPVRQAFVREVNEKTMANQRAETLKDRRAALDNVDFLDPLSEAAKESLAEHGRRRLFAPGETIIRQGDRGRAFYIVRRGRVAVRADGAQLAELGRGEFFGELALLTGSERHASVVAVDESEVFEIDENDFESVLRGEPRVAEEIAQIVGGRQAELEARRSGTHHPSVHDVKGWSGDILDKIRKLFLSD